MKNSNIEAIVFDLAGTLIDFGSLAPSQVLIKLFDRLGIKITRKQAIGPMGIEKRAHIKALLTTRKINSEWKKKFKSKPTVKDIDKLFKLFNPELKKIINKHSKFISGSKKTLDFIKNKKIKIGINTGYSGKKFPDLKFNINDNGPKIDVRGSQQDMADWGSKHSGKKYGEYEVFHTDDDDQGEIVRIVKSSKISKG